MSETTKIHAESSSSSSTMSSSSDNNLWAGLCYFFSILGSLIVLLTEKKKDKILAFHAYQALILHVGVSIIFWVLYIPLSVGAVFFPPLGLLICLVFLLLIPYVLGNWWLAYRAYQGEKFVLPIIGPHAEKLAMGS